nr:pYEATS domain-containing protein [uncultured Mucilaginibacter sp.]
MKEFLKLNKTNVLLFIFIIPFSVLMTMLGLQVIDLSKQSYLKSVEVSRLSKTVPACNDCIKYGYTQAVTYFILALGGIVLAILLPNLQSVSFGGVSITLKELKKDLNDLKTQSNDLQEKITNAKPDENTGNPAIKSLLDAEKEKAAPSDVKDDPQKGKWGGFAEANGRKLSAMVKEGNVSGFFTVKLMVTATNNVPLTGLVKFHLHDTFRNPDPVISASNNTAELQLNWVYGAFTVGVEADGGQTILELDLAELSDAPKKFREN